MYRKHRLGITLSLLAFILAVAATPLRAQQDAVLDIMSKELQREMSVLKKQDPPAYFLSYRIYENHSSSVTASLGAVKASDENASRTLTVQLRVGDYVMDDTREIRGSDGFDFDFPQFTSAPIEENEDALRLVLWNVTNQQYRKAAKKYQAVRANTAVKVEAEDKSEDFAKVDAAAKHIDPPLDAPKLLPDRKMWEEKLRSFSSVFLECEHIFLGEATMNFSAERKRLVTSEGALIAENRPSVRVMLRATIKCDDGMELPLYRSYFAHDIAGLPSDAAILADAREMVATLRAMREAPVTEPFTGPALLSGEASSVFFHEIFGHRVEGHRQKKETEGQTFKKKEGTAVLPAHMSVIFDPSLKRSGDQDLNGHYLYDDEGVRGQRVEVVKNGVLQDFLMSRTPFEKHPASNGHGRAQQGYQPVSRQSNMIISTTQPRSDEELRAMLREECKKQDKEFGLYFADVTGGFTMTGRYSPNAFNVTPTVVYRVYADGRPDELVRGVDLVGTPLVMFSNITEAGSTNEVFTGTCGAESGGVPVAAVSPAVLISKIEVQKKDKSQERAPLLARPDRDAATAKSEGPAMLGAMKDELQRSIEHLSIEGVSAPFFISYQVKDGRRVMIKATAGAITVLDTSRSRRHNVRVLVGDRKQTQEHFVSTDFGFSFSYEDYNAGLPIEDNYDAIRRELWLKTDREYKAQSEKLEKKRAALQQQQIPEEMKGVEDFAEAKPVVSIEEGKPVACDVAAWKNRVRELSALLGHDAEIYASDVSFGFHEMTVYFVNSEGSVVVVPKTLAVITIAASTQAEDGEPLMDFVLHEALTPQELPDVNTLAAEVRAMAAKLLERRSSVPMDGSYTGPVLFEDQAVPELVHRVYLGEEGLRASRMPVMEGALAMMGAQMQKRNLRDKLGKRVLPQEWTMASTPSLAEFDGVKLVGAYDIDAEGVRPPDNLLLVDKGNVASLISDRTPTPGLPSSTGHRCIGVGDGTGDGITPGVLSIEVANGPASADLKKMLLEKASEEDLEHAYIIRSIRPDAVAAPSTDDDMMSSFSMFGMDPGAGSAPLGETVRIYRVNVADGKEIPVRNVEILKPGASALRKLTASTDRRAWNCLSDGESPIPGLGMFISFGGSSSGTQGGVPTSIIAPRSVLVDEMEVRKQKRPLTSKPPIVPSPLAK